jgi:uncharacterized protein YkwD
MRTTALLFLALLMTGVAFSPRPALAQSDPEAVRREILRRINEERAKSGSPLLRLLDPLNSTAQQHAEEISRQGTLRLTKGSEDVLGERLKKLGYDVHAWTESVTAGTGDLDTVLRNWKSQDSGTYKSLMDDDYRDLGIGLSKLRGAPLYVFLFAVPEAEFFTRTTAPLRDPARVRAAMLEEVNAARRKAGAPPLRANPLLDKAAQKHAEDMLARGYFAHESPGGGTVRERAKEAGYDWHEIGENIAEGQFTVGEVMNGWLKSPGHRRNILNPGFGELGTGIVAAKGKDGQYRVLWVQTFGTANSPKTAPKKK